MLIVLASFWPQWKPEKIDVLVGETMIVQVRAMWSGLVNYGGCICWTFRTENEQVATAFAHVQDDLVHYVAVTGIGPGTTAIRQVLPSGQVEGYPSYVIIHVSCGPEAPLIALTPNVSTRLNKPVILRAFSDAPDRTAFTWFAGHIGDVSKPIDASGSQISVTPNAVGRQYVWVSAVTNCSTSAAEFAIDVSPSRHRATD